MKKTLFKTLVLAILMVAPMSLMAQQRGQGQGQRMDPAERAKQEKATLKKELGLKKDQVVKFEKIYDDFTKKRQDLMTKMRDSGSRDGIREKMDEMNKARDEALKKVLDKGQVKKYEAYLKKQAEEREKRRGQRGQGRR